MQPKTLSLQHLIRPATKQNTKPPVLFLLHGYGSNAADLFSFANLLPKQLCILSIQAPLYLTTNGRAWYSLNYENPNKKLENIEEGIASREKIAHFIDEAIAAYDLDHNAVSLLGFSQGTIMSLSVALSYPQKIKRVLALSGFVHPDLLRSGYDTLDFSNLQIYFSHGKNDEVIPIEMAENSIKILQKVGIDTKLDTFDAAHTISPRNFDALQKWLEDSLAHV